MLDSLIIKNYRNLKNFKIDSLDRVNLITGKNNTGKSSILEAIAIYAANGDIALIFELLEERGEYFKQANNNSIESNMRSLSALFTDRKISFDRSDGISIENLNNHVAENEKIGKKSVSLRFVKYFNETQTDEKGAITSIKTNVIESDEDKQFIDAQVGFQVMSVGRNRTYTLSGDIPEKFGFDIFNEKENFQFIRTRNIDKNINGKLWDYIALSPKEKFVLDALRFIEPATERITFIGDNSSDRTAVITLSNNPNVLPLRSMGDGINRILTIILALVNADNGFLLIDEFENGLHYLVQEKLWEIIFDLSKKLNVQVFVTTHSEDCIAGFEKILTDGDNSLDGKLIRLDNINGVIKQVEYNARELKIATENDIETR